MQLPTRPTPGPYVYPDGSDQVTIRMVRDTRSLNENWEPTGEPAEVFLCDQQEIIIRVPKDRPWPTVRWEEG